jgi:hypothetical protein
MRELTNQDHHTVTTLLGIKAEVDNLDLHRQDITAAHDTKEAEGLDLQSMHTNAKMTKRRWQCHALLTEFT